eukprot:GHVO01047787.1.p1 GENE.GHVO01047787.1~~GHVO01047787.1.p1  ORF type:complete len:444 (-),score=46.84 GHVO01047787.1:114-1445(-)
MLRSMTNSDSSLLPKTRKIKSHPKVRPGMFRLTVIDTPGYGDTDGLAADKETTKLIKDMFERGGEAGGVDRLDAIILVVKASDSRLNACQKHNFNSVFQLFGNDLSDNILVAATFSDAMDPPVEHTLRGHNINFYDLYKFNNSSFFQGTNVQPFYWQIGQEGFDSFFKGLNSMQPKSLSQSAQVLRNREVLENNVVQLNENVKRGVSHLEQMRKESLVLETFEAQIEANQDFEYEIKEEYVEQERIADPGQNTTTCRTCNHICHESCAYADDKDKAKCVAMDEDGNCEHCPNKCGWDMHKNLPYVCRVKTRTVMKTNDDLKAKYANSKQDKYTKDQMLENLAEQFIEQQQGVRSIIREIHDTIKTLHEIAHQPRFMTEVEYIDNLILSEESELKCGYQDRIKHLAFQRGLAAQIQAAEDPDYDPFKEFQNENQTVTNILKRFQ